MKKFILIVLMLCMVQPSHATVDGMLVNKQYKGAGGSTMKLTIFGNGKIFAPRIILANGAINNAVNVNNMLSDAKAYGKLVAAFTGTFFDSYNGTNQTYGTLYQDGQIVHHGGYNAYLVYTRSGKWKVLDSMGISELGTENIAMAVACTPRLVRDGVKSIEAGGEPDSFVNATAQRTLVGATSEGTLVVATGVLNFNNAADTLISLGCMDGMAMDGGASSFLYADGSTLQSAGRNLNNIIAIYEGTPLLSASPSTSGIFVNGNQQSFESYLINDNNYFKLRDLAYVLNGTKCQFNIEYDGAIKIVRDTPYISVGGEITAGDGASKQAEFSSDVILDSELWSYKINGNNYYKLRDVGALLGFSVSWDEESHQIKVDTP